MSGRVHEPAGSRPARAAGCFAALVAGGMIFGGIAVGFGAPFVPVLLIIVVLAAALAWCVTR